MMHVHLIPETPEDGPAWACAQIRLLRPYRHASLSQRARVTSGRALPSARLDVVVLQRGGPHGATLAELEDIARETRLRGARLVVDLDDDLLAAHPDQETEMTLRAVRPRVRFLLREAALATVSTEKLRARIAHLCAQSAVWTNALDETLMPSPSSGAGAAVGYSGTPSHLQDLMSVVASLEAAGARQGGRPSLELTGVSADGRIGRLLHHSWAIGLRQAPPAYERYHAELAGQAAWRVGLAPLARGAFNDHKSDIKVLDYAAAGIPAVVSDSPVYDGWEHGQTILRASAEDFGAAVLSLLHDEALRRRVTEAAREELMTRRILAVTAARLLDSVETCLALPAP